MIAAAHKCMIAAAHKCMKTGSMEMQYIPGKTFAYIGIVALAKTLKSKTLPSYIW